ncbi:MAG TPA: Wzt carbohydrate-binding domain-containing protein, partial [Casimicrobiaceae bacterium]|nr:Wzt carbohydrate-binding domain-containing protein [Casimicrobiaceae bacterium]
CNRTLLIHDGRIAIDGKPKEAIDVYNALALRAQDANPRSFSITGTNDAPTREPIAADGALPDVAASSRAEAPEAGSYSKPEAAITAVRVLHDDKPVDAVISESAVTVVVNARFDAAFADPHVGFQIRDARGEPVFMTHTHGMGIRIGAVGPDDQVEVRFEFRAGIAPGDYSITAGIANAALFDGQFGEALTRVQGAHSFTVLRNLDAIQWAGVCNLAPTCTVRRTPAR